MPRKQSPKVDLTQPQPGFYSDVPNDQYHAAPGVGSTEIREFMRSPAHYFAYKNRPKRTPQEQQRHERALLIGAAQHTAILEPHRYERDFAVLPEDIASRNKNSNAFKEGFQEFVDTQAKGRKILFPADTEHLLNMRDAVWDHPKAEELLSSRDKRREISVWWVNEWGVLCKCRPDLWLPGVVIDLKTTEDARPGPFSRTMWNYGYHIQAAYYSDGITEFDVEPLFGILAVEKKPPYGVTVLRMKSDAVAAGRHQYQSQMPRFAQCLEANDWPGYSRDIEVVDLPVYAYRALEEGEND